LAGWSEASALMLEEAAPMHDVGKIGVPDSILKKPGGLTDQEWEIMRLHPEFGARILGGANTPVLIMASEIAYCHHEKFDGSGYPRGLKGSDIPLAARVVSLIDYFDALTMDRVYRKALPDAAVFSMIADGAGVHFDPALVDVFLANVAAFTELRDQINRQETSGELSGRCLGLFE